jgi:hypothetical protein
MNQPMLVHGWIGPPWAGAGQMIPPQANLVFEVELLEVRGEVTEKDGPPEEMGGR